MKKALVIGVILLFIGVGLSPVITAVDNDTDVDESYEKCEIRASDTHREIISFIEDDCAGVEIRGISLIHIGVYRICLFRHVEIYTWGNRWIDLNGYKFPTKDDPEITFRVQAKQVIAPFFIGYYLPASPGCEYVRGIALGNIEWS